MKIERRKNAKNNILFGILLKLYNILLPFLMRTAMIYYLGVEYLGLNSLFTSILHVLNLAELGIGSSMVFAMYKPIAVDDRSTLCALLALYRKYYRIVGAVVLTGGVVLLPFLPKLIHGSVPRGINLYVLYLLNLFSTVSSYWLFAYRNSILHAHQRNDVISKIQLLTNTIKYCFQLIVLAVLRNYYLYVVIIIIAQILENLITAFAAGKMYPEYKPKGELKEEEKREINNRIKDFFTAKFGGTVLSSVDTVVISAFLGLRVLAIYQNYYYVMNSIVGVFTIIFTAIRAGIGNSMVLDSTEKNYQDYRTLTFITFTLISFCSACMATMYQPFITIWVGKDLLLSYSFVFLFCLYFLSVEYVKLGSVYKDAAGIWHQDRFRPLIAGLINLGLNLLMVRKYGLYGIMISTIVSEGFISGPWITLNLFKHVFNGRLNDYTGLLVKCIFMVAVVTASAAFLASMLHFQLIITMVLSLLISTFCTCLFCVLMYHKTNEYKRAKRMVLPMIRG